MMGISFSKELVVDKVQIWPNNQSLGEKTKLQDKLVQKLGDQARPFTLNFPKSAPNSVIIRGEDGDTAEMGVSFEVKLHITKDADGGITDRKSVVSMAIRKSQWAPMDEKQRSPTAKADKGFLCAKGKVNLEVSLDKEIHYHGEEIPVHININNTSKKSVKCIRVSVVQHCELTVVQAQYSCKVANLESKDGCPLGQDASLKRSITLKPLSQMCQIKRGLAVDGCLSKTKDETNLASTSLAETGNPNDLLGVIISYSINVKLVLSGMGGELEVDVPFKLLHPRPESAEASKLEELKRVSAEQNAKTDARRMKFQAQDSVVNETLGSFDK